jgi:hypothetical protein
MSKITVIGCGGMGINVASKFVGKSESGFAEFDVYLLDTSKSNMPKNVDDSKVYLFEGMDGSGKLRSSNYSTINERAKEVLQKVKPGAINLVVTSANNGNGNVITGILVNELLKKDMTVVVACVGSSDSRIEIENTVKCLKSFEVISQRVGKPVVMMYGENSADKKRGEIDHFIESNIVLMSLFFSGSNRELDMSDLRNFLNYHKVTSYAPKLTMLDFYSGGMELDRDQALVSLVTLTDENTSSSIDIPVDYQAVGFIGDDVKTKVRVGLPIHMTTVANYFHPVIERLETKMATIDEARSAVVEKSILSKGDSATDGLIM